MSRKKFKTEVSQLLKLIIHSLYSHKEIFLRELVSNASDALDKLKYLTLTDDSFKKLAFEPRIDIEFSGGKDGWLRIRDNGVGMNKEELETNLGTIARSGTSAFLEQLSGDARRDSNLIGQFGVGFYSAFMVAGKVQVLSRKAGEESAHLWTSSGESDYSVEEAEMEGWGTEVTLHLNGEGEEFASRWRIESLVKKYSNHISFPIFLSYDETVFEGEGDDKKEVEQHKIEQINNASALWRRSKSEITNEEYDEFYKTIGHDSQEPLLTIHTKAEGTQEYTTLFYIPKSAPFDLYQADFRPGVKLYVRRVFITDDSKELMPTYMRFLRGIIDSEDLPLNVSREILQQNKIMNSIRTASVKKVLGELKALADNNPDKYIEFIEQYNRPLKEGLYSDFPNREQLMELVRFKSTEREGWVSLSGYLERMPEDQKSIFYITGDKEENLRHSPLLEAYKKRGWEVLILDDEIDDIVMPTMGKYKEKEFKGVNRSGSGEELKKEGSEEKQKEEALKPLLEKIKSILGERVKDVVVSARLSDSPSCIVTDDNDPSIQIQQMMKAMGQKDLPEVKPILEINPNHPIVAKLKESDDEILIEDVSFLLFEQAVLVDGVMLDKPAEFVQRVNRLMDRAI